MNKPFWVITPKGFPVLCAGLTMERFSGETYDLQLLTNTGTISLNIAVRNGDTKDHPIVKKFREYVLSGSEEPLDLSNEPTGGFPSVSRPGAGTPG